jgi:hemoglobin
VGNDKQEESAKAAVVPQSAAPANGSLYERLGGRPTIVALVDDFRNRLVNDPRIKERFFNVDGPKLRNLLVDFVCVETGGPCKYTGRDMTITHAGMDLVEEEFDGFMDDLSDALTKLNVAEREKSELLDKFTSLKPEMLAAPDRLKPIDDAKFTQVMKFAATLKDQPGVDLLIVAAHAARRGQRSYAEQLFSRAELLLGVKPVAPVASVFRAGAPPRVTTTLKKLAADTAAQPNLLGSSDVDNPDKKYAGGNLRGTVTINGKSPSGLGVVMLWPEKNTKKRVPKLRFIEQRNKAFAPHVMAVPVGSTVAFPNFDPVFHNVFSLSKIKPFDLGMYKNGESREVKVDKAGIVRLGCNLHASMMAYLIVVDAPHYVVVDADGSYSFKSLAPGKYRVQAWNENIAEPLTTNLVIHPGLNEDHLEIKGDAAATGSPDKFGTSRSR